MMDSKIQILVVDDEPYIVRSLAFVLEREGLSIATARNGNEAIVKVRELKPKVMFLDIMMPGKNGFEVCSMIKKDPELKDIFVIMFTAMGQEEDKAKSLACGADEYMTKPFSPKQLVKRINEIFKEIA